MIVYTLQLAGAIFLASAVHFTVFLASGSLAISAIVSGACAFSMGLSAARDSRRSNQ